MKVRVDRLVNKSSGPSIVVCQLPTLKMALAFAETCDADIQWVQFPAP